MRIFTLSCQFRRPQSGDGAEHSADQSWTGSVIVGARPNGEYRQISDVCAVNNNVGEVNSGVTPRPHLYR